MNTEKWTPRISPYDPRRVDGATVTEDEHGRLIESADCGTRCPGCGICCAGYRDVVTADYAGEEDFAGNFRQGRGGLVRLGDGLWYRSAHCGQSCPGYGECCPPFDLRQRPQTVDDARRILLERDDSQRWEMQEALLILAHEGSAAAVAVLESYLPRAHARLEGFAECALEEGRYSATVPRNAEEALRMLKQRVRQNWEDRACEIQSRIDEELRPELERRQYELEVARRLLEKAADEAARETWRIQVDVFEMLVGMAEGEIEEQLQEMALCDAFIAEIDADLASEA